MWLLFLINSYMSDILVTKSIETLRAFFQEFKHIIPNDNGAIFYIKRNDNIIPFRAFAFKLEDNSMRVQIETVNGKRVHMNVRNTDEVYFTTNVIFLSDYSFDASLDNLIPFDVYLKPQVTPTANQ